MRFLPFLALIGCPTLETDHVDIHTLSVELNDIPERTGDPVNFEATLTRTWDGQAVELCPGEFDPDITDSEYGCESDHRDTALVLNGPDGEVLTEALLTAEGARWAWTVPEGSPAGIYQVAGVDGLDLPLAQPIAFEIFDYGDATDFSAADLVGQTFEVDDYATSPFDAASLVESVSPRILFTVDAVDGDVATFRVIAQSPDALCTVLRSEADVVGATLLWQRDRLEIEHPELGILAADDMVFEIAWRTGAPNAPDVRADATIDLRPYADILPVDDVCETIESVGAHCQACPDGEVECFDAHVNRGRLVLVTDMLSPTLPLCGIEDVEVGETNFSCDVDWDTGDCGCDGGGRTGGSLGLLLAMAVGLRRRRR